MENQVQNNLPNATATLVMGIFSILGCMCYGIFGLIIGIIALVISNAAWKQGKANPDAYANFGNIKIGRLLAKIGIVLSALFMIGIIVLIVMMGGIEGYMDWAQEQSRNAF